MNMTHFKNVFFKNINLLSRWISQLSWFKFFIFIVLVAIGSDHAQMLFTDNIRENWFGGLTGLFIVFCLGSKLLINSKVKSEDIALAAIDKAQKETLARMVNASKLNVIQSQINPRFLFNTLASLQYLIDSNSTKAQELLTQTVIYLRYVLQSHNDKKTVFLMEEFQACKAYLEIIKFRLSDRFDYLIKLDNLNKEQLIPYTVIQNILDSCITYGIEPNINKSYIHIYSLDNCLIIENNTYSSAKRIELINDIYLKNIIGILQSMNYSIEFDVSESDILKIKIK